MKACAPILAELVGAGIAAHDHPVAELHVARRASTRLDRMMWLPRTQSCADVRVRQEQVVVADAGDADAGRRCRDCTVHVFAEHVAVADLEPGRLALVLLVLRRIADARRTGRPVVGAERGRAVDHRMRTDPARGPMHHVGADDGERPDLDVVGELRLRARRRRGGRCSWHVEPAGDHRSVCVVRVGEQHHLGRCRLGVVDVGGRRQLPDALHVALDLAP